MAAGNTYTQIASTTLGSAASSVTFSSIAGTYTDLVLVTAVANNTASGNYFGMQFNGDTTANYSQTQLYGDGTSAASSRYTGNGTIIAGWTSTSISTLIFNIMNYANTTTYKTALIRNANSAYREGAWVALWRKTPEAITSITMASEGATLFTAGSTFTLYGILAA